MPDRSMNNKRKAWLLGRILVSGGTLASRLLEGAVDTLAKHPKTLLLPAAGTAAGIFAKTKNSPSATVSWTDPRKNEYYLDPGILTHRLYKRY